MTRVSPNNHAIANEFWRRELKMASGKTVAARSDPWRRDRGSTDLRG